MLSAWASEIREAADGAEAVRVFAEQQPDCVIMDLQMKPVGGLAATTAIRQRWPAARVVLLTQYEDADLSAAATRAGACACLLKEDLSQLVQLVSPDSSLTDPAATATQRADSASTNNHNLNQKNQPL